MRIAWLRTGSNPADINACPINLGGIGWDSGQSWDWGGQSGGPGSNPGGSCSGYTPQHSSGETQRGRVGGGGGNGLFIALVQKFF